MLFLGKYLVGVLTLSSMVTIASSTSFAQKVERPPQFVLMSFDGSKEIKMWQNTREFAAQMTAAGKPLKFTYFISGVYWLTDQTKNLYKGPYRKSGRSDIGFSTTKEDLLYRIDEVNGAFSEGHEMGSHGNGHFDGSDLANKRKSTYSPWTEEDWTSEFKQFYNLVFGVFQNNGLKTNRKYLFSERDITGFRAPVLGVTEGLWPTMTKFGFKYDASKVNSATYWPQKDRYGLWQFPLAMLPVVGTAKKTLSMDYNFYAVQSKAVKDEGNKELYKKQMYDSYMSYFKTNYYGKRAPLNIGHHFSRWNGGAYWEALQDFAKSVCGQSEVRCVTYSEYVQWLESKNAATLAAFTTGQFKKLSESNNNYALKGIDLKLNPRLRGQNIIKFEVSGADADNSKYHKVVKVNGETVPEKYVDMDQLRKEFPNEQVEISGHIVDNKGVEMASSTYTILNLGTENEFISMESLEEKALQGDLPEAHLEEQE